MKFLEKTLLQELSVNLIGGINKKDLGNNLIYIQYFL